MVTWSEPQETHEEELWEAEKDGCVIVYLSTGELLTVIEKEAEVNLCTPEIALKLVEYQDCQTRIRTLEAEIKELPPSRELKVRQKRLTTLNTELFDKEEKCQSNR